MAAPGGTQRRTKFYKYMKAGTAKAVLANGALRWSSPTLFNDPFEMQFDLHIEYNRDRLVDRVLQRYVDVFNGRVQAQPGNEFHENIKILRAVVPDLKEADLRNEQRPAIHESLKRAERGLPKIHEELRAILADKKIICFSELPDNILMWAHYCENHTGAVVEFSYIEKYASVWGAAKPVRYMAHIPLLADEEAMFRSLTGQESIASPERFYDAVYVKAQDWAYEKEWRTLGGWDKSRQTENIAFKREEVTAVYLGCRMDDANRKEIKKIVKKRYPHAVVYIGRKSARQFALEFAKAS